MQKRILGETGQQLSLIGLGGVALLGLEQKEADALVAEAVDRGVNYFDVAPSYGHDQEAEKRLGPALHPYRNQVFLACKTARRDRAGAEQELHRSLQHLQTDYFDLYQLHAITTLEEVEACFAPNGAMEAIVQAQQAGLVRYIGFSAHSVQAALLAMERFDFDTALFPVNFVTYLQGNFGPHIFARAQEKGVGCLALKAMARTHWAEGAPRSFPHCWYEPIADPELAELAFRFTLSQPVTAAIAPGDPRLFRMGVEFAERFQPLTSAELSRLEEEAKKLQPIFQAA